MLSLQPLGTRTFHPILFQLSIAIRIEVIRILLLAIPLSTNLLRLHFAAAFISAFTSPTETLFRIFINFLPNRDRLNREKICRFTDKGEQRFCISMGYTLWKNIKKYACFEKSTEILVLHYFRMDLRSSYSPKFFQ